MKTSDIDQSIRISINELSDQLCKSVDGIFNFKLTTPSSDIDVQKLVMLINFLLDQYDRSTIRLEESKSRLSTIMDNVIDGIIVINEQGLIESVNPAVTHLFGYGHHELIGQNVSVLVPTPDKEKHDSYIANYLTTKLRRIIGIGREIKAQRKDGTIFPAELSINEFELDGKIYFNGLIRDISEKKRLEKVLRESEQQFRGMVTNIPGVIYRCLLDENWTMLYISDGVKSITGYAADEFTNNKIRSYASVIHQDDQDKVDAVVNKAIKQDEPYEVEYRVNHKNGEVRWVYEKGQAIIDEQSNVQYLDGAIFDISEVKESQLKLQEAQEREAIQKGKLEMSSSVLHDIGNAVTNLGTVTNRLLSDKEWSETDELNNLHDLFKSEKQSISDAIGEERCEALLEFINELQGSLRKKSETYHTDFQRILKTVSHVNDILHIQRRYAKTGTLIQRDQLNLLDIISDSLSVMSGSVEKRDITLNYQFPDEIPKVQGDRTHLMQVFSNLVKNSCESFDALDDSGTLIEKKITVALTTNKNTLVLEIKDNAKGFDPALSEKLFEQGYSTKHRDSGIGLYQCRKTIESHGGTLKLTSEGIGTGATAVIQLPIHFGGIRE